MPAKTWPPALTGSGSASPVSIDLSMSLAPAVTMPSTGTRSPGGDPHGVARDDVGDRDMRDRAVGRNAHGAPRRERHQPRRGGARDVAHPVVEEAADEEEEEERHRRVEIGVLAAGRGLVEAHRRGEEDADRDRHVHVEAPAEMLRSAERKKGRPA